jgi:hypothetical protein
MNGETGFLDIMRQQAKYGWSFTGKKQASQRLNTGPQLKRHYVLDG